MKHHVELKCIGSVEVEVEYCAENLKMSAGTYREILGKSLNYAKDKGVKPVHLLSVFNVSV